MLTSVSLLVWHDIPASPSMRTPSRPSSPKPLLWRVRGFYAGLEWHSEDGLYTASVPELPGCCGRGPDRTAALRSLDRALEKLLEGTSAR
jgi:predicted RNase H-like HicB family nuclease